MLEIIPIDEVKFKGVGEEKLKKLRDAKLNTVNALAIMTEMELVSYTGFTIELAQSIISQARDIISPGFITAEDLAHRQIKQDLLHTGSSQFNRILGGGIHSQAITELIGEFGCHSDETNVFTPDGEKNWREVKLGDYVYGVNENFEIVPSQVIKIHEYPFNGELYEFKTNRVQLEVTGNHDIYYKKYSKEKQFKKTKAEETKSWGYIKCDFSSLGEKTEFVDISQFIEKPPLDHPEKSHPRHNKHVFKTEDLLELMGFYISDGNPLRQHHSVYPSISHKKNVERLNILLNKMGLEHSTYEDIKHVIFNENLGRYLLRCGEGALNKTIPDEILELHPEQLKHLFNGLMQCDAHHNGFTYYTISKKLVDKFMLLAMKLGYNTSYRKEPPIRTQLKDGRIIEGKHDCYYINISYKPKGYYDKKQKTRIKKPYKGNVWCFTTTTGNFFTVLNGQPTLSGNSSKTQICVTTAVIAASQGKNVAVIDTEGTFMPERITQIAEGRGYDPLEIRGRIRIARAYTAEHLHQLIKYLPSLINDFNIQLIILDSIITHFRSEYLGLGNLATRQQKLAEIIHGLQRAADGFGIPVIVTNQVQTKVGVMFGDPNQGAGGHIMAHGGTYRIMLRKGREDKRTGNRTILAQVIDASHLPDEKIRFMISSAGIVDEDGSMSEKTVGAVEGKTAELDEEEMKNES